jgi:predicted ATPase
MKAKLTSISLSGFKTFRELKDFELRPINVLIGANSSGKSNFISFFRMLAKMLDRDQGLQLHVGKYGGASAFLHDGPQETKHIEASISLESGGGTNNYRFRLTLASGDVFIFADEQYSFTRRGRRDYPLQTLGDAGHREPQLNEIAKKPGPPRALRGILRKIEVHQFHNTSFASPLRLRCDRNDTRFLKEDGGNLAAFLLKLRDSRDAEDRDAYQMILDAARLLIPSFEDYVLEPEGESILLRWREKGCDQEFHSGQASDGMLRLMALIALLRQPDSTLPEVLFIDEPELGLHPHAISTIAEMMRGLSQQTQLIIATQSPALVDKFEPEDVVVVNRLGRESVLERMSKEDLKEWLDEYSLGELWRKNVLGGGPFA